MRSPLDNLIRLINLAQLDDTTFTGESMDIGTGRVYGGQVLGQALKAAQVTVGDKKTIHSMHAYFLREGDHSVPITYHVDITRNGRSFSTRRVTAIQDDHPIFITDMSFQIPETGEDYQTTMPDIPEHGSFRKLTEINISENLSDRLQNLIRLTAPFELKPVPVTSDQGLQGKSSFLKPVWIKTSHEITDEPDIHRALLAYISDYGLVTTTLLPHNLEFDTPSLQLASIDHAMWFHRPFRVDQWLLYVCEPVSTSNARGLARGRFYDHDGKLIASTMQEGLIRQIKKGE